MGRIKLIRLIRFFVYRDSIHETFLCSMRQNIIIIFFYLAELYDKAISW